MAERNYATSTIKAYVSHVGVLFELRGSPIYFSPSDEALLLRLYRGIDRTRLITGGIKVQRKCGFTPQDLLRFRSELDFSKSFDTTLWCLLLVGFFTFLRSDNLVPRVRRNPGSHVLTRGDFTKNDWGWMVRVRESKTNQLGEKINWIPMLELKNNPLCPVWAIKRAWECFPADESTILAAYGDGIINYSNFLGLIKELCNRTGLDPAHYGTHSLRRGGASLASQSGADPQYIKLHGDWVSDAYTLYTTVPLVKRLIVPNALAGAIKFACGDADTF
jgi:hypothetical protein